MVHPLLFLASGYLLAELYKKYATPVEKSKWKNYVKMHHGEAGAIMTGVGILTKSPRLTTTGIGLMFHDRKDQNKWFKNQH
jgi:hypothetical protein